MRLGPIPALLCALALLAGCVGAPVSPATPAPTASPTPPPPMETPEPPLPAETAAPEPLRVPDGLTGCALAYAQLIVEAEVEAPGRKYDLVYLDEDGVPELVVGHPGYYVTLYKYTEGTLYCLGEWSYGVMGNHGYEYIPRGNVIRNYNADLAGAIMYVWYGKLGGHEIESYYNEPLSQWMFLDQNGNYQMDEDEPYSDHLYYYYGDREITEAEFEAYQIPGNYQWLEGSQTAACLLAQLQAAARKEAWGLDGQLPYYAYRDEEGDLQLELYFDPDAGTGRGFRYQWDDPGLPAFQSFTVSGVEDGIWEGRPPDSVRSVDGADGSDLVRDYQSSYEYDEEGRRVRFRSWGSFEPGSLDTADIIRVEFYHRGDGTLARKEYWHNSMLFGTTLSTAAVHYDWEERPVYLRGYITHGHLEYYPIYGEGSAPEYCLLLDFNPDRIYPVMYRFK